MKSKRLTITIISLLVAVTTIVTGVLVYFLLPKGEFARLKYLAIGDSITYGFDSGNDGKQMDKPYPELVKQELGLGRVYNKGISGSTLTSVDSFRNPMSVRYKDMPRRADIVSVMGGINDYMLGNAELGTIDDTDTTTIYGALNTLASGLKEKYRSAYIFFMTPFKWRWDGGVNAKGYSLPDLCNAIKEVCEKYDIDVLDMYTYGQMELDYASPTCDGLHPTQWFFENYTAPQIAKFIKDNYNK